MKGNQMTIKVGDKVRYTGPSKHDMTNGKVYEVCGVYERGFEVLDDVGDANGIASESYELVTDTPALPPIWDDMNDAEKGALLLARHEERAIEYYDSLRDEWHIDLFFNPIRNPDSRYRVAEPEPVVETVTLDGGLYQDCGHTFEKADYNKSWYTHRITFNTIDGKPDPDSIKMEEL